MFMPFLAERMSLALTKCMAASYLLGSVAKIEIIRYLAEKVSTPDIQSTRGLNKWYDIHLIVPLDCYWLVK